MEESVTPSVATCNRGSARHTFTLRVTDMSCGNGVTTLTVQGPRGECLDVDLEAAPDPTALDAAGLDVLAGKIVMVGSEAVAASVLARSAHGAKRVSTPVGLVLAASQRGANTVLELRDAL